MSNYDDSISVLILSLLFLIPLCGCQPAEQPAKARIAMASDDGTSELAPGVYQQTISRETGSPIRYTISIPQGYTEAESVPFVMALHFGGRVTPFYGEGILSILVEPALQELGAIIVAPDSIAGPWTNEENEAAVLELYHSIIKQHRVDKNKTLLTGFSMGGHGTWYIGSRNQDLFRALIPIAGSPRDDSIDWTIPVYAIHSNADTVVPIDRTRDYVKKMSAKGSDIQLIELDGIQHFQTTRFAEPLTAAIPWLQKIWASPAKNDGSVQSDN